MEFQAKAFQQSVLDSIRAYFEACHEFDNPSVAFTVQTERLWGRASAYRSIEGLPADMPYFCLRVPTGGGKTWIAAKSVLTVNSRLLRSEHSVILWLVPSNAIRQQTLRALKDRDHPYCTALKDVGSVTVLDLEEAKSVTRATLQTSTAVIVCTRQSFQRESTDILKAYESSGALMQHFEGLSQEQRGELLEENDGTVPYSLVNVLRMHRPFIIVDEAHNSRTPLSFETLSRFRPSGIMELTATPDVDVTPSNVLHSVSAAELKTEEMIKLPIILEAEPDWQQCLNYAKNRRDELQTAADKEQRKGSSYLRPLVLIQADRKSNDRETLDVEVIRKELVENQNLPDEEIVIATGEERGLAKLAEEYEGGISSEKCPVKYVITQKALAEGWDCPFAYILVSMAELRSATAVEQLLGRVLRQPDASRRKEETLNQSYAYVVSRDFRDTANALRDRLVEGAGFERRDANEFVTSEKSENLRLDLDGRGNRIHIKQVDVELNEDINLKGLPNPVKDKIAWDKKSKTLTIREPLTESESDVVVALGKSKGSKNALTEAAAKSREAPEYFATPAEQGQDFVVPQMALNVQGEFEVFDDPEVLDYPWDLSTYDAAPSSDDLDQLEANRVAEGGKIDVTDEGRVRVGYIANLQHDLGLAYTPEHWDVVKLAAWLCKNIPERSLTHASKRGFVASWLQSLLQREDFDLARVNRQKFLIRNLIEQKIRELRLQAVSQAFQNTLFSDGASDRVSVGGDYQYDFHPYGYAPGKVYDNRYGFNDFRRHYYGEIGDFDSKEEFECACWLDDQAQRGKIDFWVRNLVRKEGCSFFLQKANGRFYPDFLCRLPDGVVLAVEYKGSDRWKAAEDDRLIGDLWEEMSGGKCRFVMVTDKDWTRIEAKLKS